MLVHIEEASLKKLKVADLRSHLDSMGGASGKLTKAKLITSILALQQQQQQGEGEGDATTAQDGGGDMVEDDGVGDGATGMKPSSCANNTNNANKKRKRISFGENKVKTFLKGEAPGSVADLDTDNSHDDSDTSLSTTTTTTATTTTATATIATKQLATKKAKATFVDTPPTPPRPLSRPNPPRPPRPPPAAPTRCEG